MSIGPGSSGTTCEINVTPLIDVLLVLLIVFMIITPLTSRGLPTLVPEANLGWAPITETPLVLQIQADHTLRLNHVEITAGALEFQIDQLFSARASKVLFIEANRNLEYRDVAQLIDLIRGVNPSIQVGFVNSES